MVSLKLDNHFRDFEHFCLVLVNEVFNNVGLLKELQHIEYIDAKSDLGNRIFVMVGETEYMIRTWNVYDTDSNVFVDYTLFVLKENGEYETV